MSQSTPETSQVIACTPAWTDEEHADWLGVSARFLTMMNEASGRSDLLVKVRPDTEHLYNPEKSRRPIAAFVPALAEVRLTANRVWAPTKDDPARIDPNNASDRARHPAMMGVMAHEAGHAAHTRIEFPSGVAGAVAQWATILEEPRMEAQQVRRRPQDRQWLRASAMELAAGGSLTLSRDTEAAEEAPSVALAVRSAVLFLGRVAAGILTETECAVLRKEIAAVLGDERMSVVDGAIEEAMTLADGDTEGLCRVGEDLAALCAPEEQDQSQDADSESGESGEGGDSGGQEQSQTDDGDPDDGDTDDGSEGTGSDSGEPDSDPSSATDGGSGSEADGTDGEAHQMPCGSWTGGDLPEDVDPWEAPAHNPADGDEPRLTNAITATADAVAEDATETARAAQFPATPPGKSNHERRREEQARAQIESAVAQCGSESRAIQIAQRAPGSNLHAAARAMTVALRRAQFRGTKRDKVASIAPPGRMRMAGVMRQQAQRDAKVRVTAKPFKQTRRRTVENPPLTVGFSGDVSGSMQAAQREVADLSWVLSQAVTHLSGKVAAVAWNQQAAFTIRPGVAPAHVAEAVCDGGSGGCAVSLDALDGTLNLSSGTGARMVVVVTDGMIRGAEDITRIVKRMRESGVHVLWVSTTERGWSPEGAHRVNVDLHQHGEFAAVVGDAIVDMLRAA